MKKTSAERNLPDNFSALGECWRHRKLYIAVLSICTFLAFLSAFLTPKEYASFAKISDEHAETDVLIGLDAMTAQLRNMQPKDLGISSPMVYGTILHSDGFLQALAKTRIEGENGTYQQHLGIEDTDACIDVIKSKLKYKIDDSRYTITIRMSDTDPLVAAHLTDTILSLLHRTLSQDKEATMQMQIGKTQKEKDEALAVYRQAQQKYDTYLDEHFDISSPAEKQMLAYLKAETTRTLLLYQKKQEQYDRALALEQKPLYPFSVLQTPTVALTPFRPNAAAYIAATDLLAFIFLTWLVLGRRAYRQFLKA